MSERPRLTFVVPVRDDAARLTRCLASIRAQRHEPGTIEIVVADNGSTDGSVGVAQAGGARVLDLPGVSVSVLRNTAARAASADVIAFVDADHELAPGWVDAALATLATHEAAAAGAPYHPPPAPTWVQRQYDHLRRRRAGIHEAEWLGSGNLAVQRRVFVDVGGFDTTLETCEDVDFCRRLRLAGHRLVSDGRLVSIHVGDPATLRALFRGELWRGRDNLRVTLRPPRTLRSLLSLAMPTAFLGLLAALAAGVVVAAVGGGGGVAAWAAAGLAVLVAIASLRMLAGARIRPLDLVQVPVVAAVYGAARALALVVRASHRVRRR